MSRDHDEWVAYIRSLNVPPDMKVSRGFVDYIADLAASNRNPSGRDELNQTIAHLTGALMEVINALGRIDDGMRKRR